MGMGMMDVNGIIGRVCVERACLPGGRERDEASVSVYPCTRKSLQSCLN